MPMVVVLVSAVAACSAPIPAATFGKPVGAPSPDIPSPSVTSPTPSIEVAVPTLAAPSWIAPDLDPALAEGLASLAWTVGGNGRQDPWRFGTYGGPGFTDRRAIDEADLAAIGGHVAVTVDGMDGSDISILDATSGVETELVSGVLPGPSDGYVTYAIPSLDGQRVFVADDGASGSGRLVVIDVPTHDVASLVPSGRSGGQVTNLRWSSGGDVLLHSWCWVQEGCQVTVVGPDEALTFEVAAYPVAATRDHVLAGVAPELQTWVILDVATQRSTVLRDPEGLVRRPLSGSFTFDDGSFIVDSGGQVIRVNAADATTSVLVDAERWQGWIFRRDVIDGRWILLERDRSEQPGGLTDAEMRQVGALDVTTGAILPEVARRAP